MSIGLTPYYCDSCGQQRKLTNHWFVSFFLDNTLCFLTWEDAAERGRLSDSNTKHFCGQVCTQKYLSKFLNGEVCGDNH